MDPQDLLLTAVRTTVVYFFLLLVVRLLGKREVGNTTAFDLIVALMLGEVVDEIIYGNVSMVKGMLVIGIVALWHLINSWTSFKSKFIDKLTGASPTILVENGEIIRQNLAKERLNEDELFSEMRLMGIDKTEEVRQATLEPNGKISVIKHEWARPIQKSDLPQKEKQAV